MSTSVMMKIGRRLLVTRILGRCLRPSMYLDCNLLVDTVNMGCPNQSCQWIENKRKCTAK